MFLFPMTKIVDLTPIMTHDEYKIQELQLTKYHSISQKVMRNKTILNPPFSKIN